MSTTPAVEGPALVPIQAEPPRARPGVLVVDDEEEILSSLGDLLDEDFEVYTARSAAKGLAILETADVAVIVSDQRMPGLTGDQFLARASNVSTATRILLTGYTDMQALMRAINGSHIYAYLEKPWDPDELKAAINQAADYFYLARRLHRSKVLLQERLRRSEGVAGLGQAALGGLPLDELMQRVTEVVREDLQARGCAVLEEKDRSRSVRAGSGRVDPFAPGVASVPLITEGTRCELRVWADDRPALSAPEAHFLDAVATVLTLAIRRLESDEALRAKEEQFLQSQKMEAIGRLAGGVAHDFNNMLTAIRGNCELVLSDLDLRSPLRPLVEQIRVASERSAGITSQLLAFSRRQSRRPQAVDLNRVLRESAAMLRPLLGAAVELGCRFGSELWPVYADPAQLVQVVLNLAVNARDAMPGGGSLRMSTSNEVRNGEEWVCLSVTDTGSGIEEATLERIFEPFFTTKPAGKGTGLGLSTVYGIVTQAGGDVEVESRLGLGTIFRIHLPRAAEREEAPAPDAASPTRDLVGSETLLVTDDEPVVLALAARSLRRLGYRVLEAADGPSALATLREHPVDLLVTDVVLPGMSGPRLAERAREVRPRCRVLFMSGYSEEDLPLSGAHELLEKPFTLAELAAAVRRALGLE